jgi:hypothetical protein
MVSQAHPVNDEECLHRIIQACIKVKVKVEIIIKALKEARTTLSEHASKELLNFNSLQS